MQHPGKPINNIKIKPVKLLQEYYLPYTKAYQILSTHSLAVATKALAIAKRLQQRSELEYNCVDIEFTYQAALLHDIGIFTTYAPELGCFGTQPYLRHGISGYEILLSEGLPRHANVCKTHIGVGLKAKDIIEQQLPLPPQDFIPQSIEEKIITYADLFFSKSPGNLEQEKSADSVRRSVVNYGIENGATFDQWHNIFAQP
ncbi:MAG: hypothetical protein B6I36_07290 [Desulfobacteraceae bacterium 4572_35.1]|nr:MAG: hypothetical protein B6I36_07290 [Desulfobacteraceae bacterium 4572_35.1]